MSEGFSIITQEYLMKLIDPKTMAILGALILLTAILVFISKKNVFNTKLLAYGALAISLAFVLSYLRLMKLPNGGTITVASMLPIFIFAYMKGTRAGITAGLCFGLLQAIQDPYIVHWAQFLLDYPIAFALLGLAGSFKENIYLGAIAGGVGRFICHFLSGVIFFGSYAPEGQSVYVYSLLYNASYMLPDIIICVGILTVGSVRKAIKRVQIRGV